MNVTLNYGILLDMRMYIKRIGDRSVDSKYRHVLLLDVTPDHLVFISDLRLPIEPNIPLTLGFQLCSKEGTTIMQSVGTLRWKEECKLDGYYQYGVTLESTITTLYSLINSSKSFHKSTIYEAVPYEVNDGYLDIGHEFDIRI